MFKINYIRILRNKDRNPELYKNLKPGTYEFKKNVSGINYWGEGINIQAVVGKKGMGKSTLMNLLYIAINNISYMFFILMLVTRQMRMNMFYTVKEM